MKVKVIGIEKVDYTNKQGRRIQGTKLYCCYSKEKISGYATDDFYFNNEFPNIDKVKLNQEVNIFFNQYGKADFLTFSE